MKLVVQILGVFTFFFIAFSFVNAEINPVLWTKDARFYYIALSFIFSIPVVGMNIKV